MNWSLPAGRIAGIPIFLHWTFILALTFFWWWFSANNQPFGIALVILLFACVLLHELGHALAARRYGIQTDSITMLPIGGLARLQRMPKKPEEEVVIAIAGPAVNVAIAMALAGTITAAFGFEAIFGPFASAPKSLFLGVLQWLLTANLVLVFFNMIPAFPMDGGRVLRAVLASQMPYARATRIAAWIGQTCAVFFVFAGMFGLFGVNGAVLIFVGLFVFLGAEAEAEAAEQAAVFENVTVQSAIQPRFSTLNETDTLALAVNELLAGSQRDFPVMRGDQVVGVLHRDQLVRGLSERGYSASVRDMMKTQWIEANLDEPIEEVYQEMLHSKEPMIPVLRQGKIAGILTLENIHELMMIRNALKQYGIKLPPTASRLPAVT
jgi:Zn-dependent protease/predicted transcriptional regulator